MNARGRWLEPGKSSVEAETTEELLCFAHITPSTGTHGNLVYFCAARMQHEGRIVNKGSAYPILLSVR